MEKVDKYGEEIFENIKHINEYGQEFWYARELQDILQYTQWRRFREVIDRAIESCRASGNDVEDHFADVGKMVVIGSGRYDAHSVCLLFNRNEW